jgi:hypothetical protein
MSVGSNSTDIRCSPSIPDYLIYDEIKRRREKEAWQPERLEMPLYRPEIRRDPIDEEDADDEKSSSDRGVFIIDMNDLVDPSEADWEEDN